MTRGDEIIARGIAFILFLPLYLFFGAILAAFDFFVNLFGKTPSPHRHRNPRRRLPRHCNVNVIYTRHHSRRYHHPRRRHHYHCNFIVIFIILMLVSGRQHHHQHQYHHQHHHRHRCRHHHPTTQVQHHHHFHYHHHHHLTITSSSSFLSRNGWHKKKTKCYQLSFTFGWLQSRSSVVSPKLIYVFLHHCPSVLHLV